MEKRWLIKTPIDSTSIDDFRSEIKVDSLIASLLLQRGISSFEDAKSFFRPDLTDLHDPFLMQDMHSAAERLSHAIDNGEKILLFGDYDVDGTTAVTLLYTFLKTITSEVTYYIPDRYAEGYGVSRLGIDRAINNGIQLIISLDCGIRSIDHVAYAKENGIDFIVCDHHQPGEQLPDGIILDPKRADCSYPYKELSGCGVGFKLLQALCFHRQMEQQKLFDLIDLVAVSIGADIVPITGENRILCFHGMQLLNEQPRKAFRELIELSNRKFPLTLTDVVFTIAPRINAAGRLRSGAHAVELMISEDIRMIQQLAAEINADNQQRRELDQEITQQALALIAKDLDFHQKRTTVVCQADWHKGVVGIVASRLIETHYRPTIVLTESNGMLTGSARTVENFDLHDALTKCADLLVQFGGHKHAAGLTLLPENLVPFGRKFDQLAKEEFSHENRVPEVQVDAELSFSELFLPHENRMQLPKIKRILDQFEPHGPGNMKPVFLATNVYAKEVRVLKEMHLKLAVTQPHTDVVVDAIAFGLANKMNEVAAGIPFEIVFTLEKNSWNNRETLQLNIKDIRASL